MSDLVMSAQFIRMGRNPFGPKPKDVRVLGQLLVGGAGVWIFTGVGDGPEPSPTFRVDAERLSEFDALRVGFAVADPGVPCGDASTVVERLRREAAERGAVTVSGAEAATIGSAVSGLDVHLHITLFGGGPGWQHPDPGGWLVTTAAVTADTWESH